MTSRIAQAFEGGRLFDAIIPVPESLKIVAGRCGADHDLDQIALAAQQKSNIDTHGFKDWYDFCINQWGTKWDVGSADGSITVDSDTELTLRFSTAWSPPMGVYQALLDQGYTVDAYYHEPGMGFCGHYTEDGDESYDITGNSDWVRDNIPSDIDDAMGISEGMAEWEEEEIDQEVDSQ